MFTSTFLRHALLLCLSIPTLSFTHPTNTVEQRISNAKAHIIVDSCFAVASFNLQARILKHPLIEGVLQHLEALGKCCVGEFGAARRQRTSGSQLILDGFSNYKRALIITSAQLACAYGLKSRLSNFIDNALAPLHLPPPAPLHHQTVHTAASFVSNYLVLDAWRNLAPQGQTIKLATSTGYLTATLALNYHHGELVDKYLLKTGKNWSSLDKQLTMAKNIVPSLVAYSLM